MYMYWLRNVEMDQDTRKITQKSRSVRYFLERRQLFVIQKSFYILQNVCFRHQHAYFFYSDDEEICCVCVYTIRVPYFEDILSRDVSVMSSALSHFSLITLNIFCFTLFTVNLEKEFQKSL